MKPSYPSKMQNKAVENKSWYTVFEMSQAHNISFILIKTLKYINTQKPLFVYSKTFIK